MKKIIKPFDLEAVKNGAKVETRNGYNVEILRTDLKNSCPILGIVTGDDGYESFVGCRIDGTSPFSRIGDNSNDLVIVEYEDEEEEIVREEEEIEEERVVISEEVELNLTYCDNGIFYEVHYKNDDSNSDKSIICPRDEQVNKLGESLLSLVRDRMDSSLTNKVKIELKLTPIKK